MRPEHRPQPLPRALERTARSLAETLHLPLLLQVEGKAEERRHPRPAVEAAVVAPVVRQLAQQALGPIADAELEPLQAGDADRPEPIERLVGHARIEGAAQIASIVRARSEKRRAAAWASRRGQSIPPASTSRRASGIQSRFGRRARRDPLTQTCRSWSAGASARVGTPSKSSRALAAQRSASASGPQHSQYACQCRSHLTVPPSATMSAACCVRMNPGVIAMRGAQPWRSSASMAARARAVGTSTSRSLIGRSPGRRRRSRRGRLP